tara:strand:- start:3235 stop:3537 length:303 start_codon:yes stop_codon:yes gene_type:complete
MAQIKVRSLAELDLQEIWLYLSEISEEIADSILADFDQKFHLLAENPRIGRVRPELLVNELRSFPAGKYIIFYLPLSDGIDVVRVLHSRREIDSIISEPL